MKYQVEMKMMSGEWKRAESLSTFVDGAWVHPIYTLAEATVAVATLTKQFRGCACRVVSVLPYTPTANQVKQAAAVMPFHAPGCPYCLVVGNLVEGWFPTQQGARLFAHQHGYQEFSIGRHEVSAL